MTPLIELYISGAWTALDFEANDIDPLPIVERHLIEYSFGFRHKVDHDAQTYNFGTPVRVTADATIIFRGMITAAQRAGDPGAESIAYRCESWWYAIAQFILEVNGIPRVVYNARPDDPLHDPDRQGMNIGQILTNAVALVQASISTFTTGKLQATWPGISQEPGSLDFIPPKTTFESRNFQDVIKETLKWVPDVFLSINRDTGLFTFSRRQSTATHNLTAYNRDTPAAPDELESIHLNPRLDLVLPRIVLKFPIREEWWECYIDHDLTLGTPDYLVGIPETVTALNDLQFQVSHRPIHQLIEVIGAGNYTVSQPAGIITFRDHPANFYVRWIAEESQQTFDTGLGGTGYTDYGLDYPVYRAYLADLPILRRKFFIRATDGVWLFCPAFGEAYPDPEMWPAILGATNGNVTAIAYHTFTFQIGITTYVINAIGIQVSGGIAGNFVTVVVEDNTGAVTALADSWWRALRDVRREGEIPSFNWLPALQIGHRINLLNTNDSKLNTMAEPIYELQFDLLGRTRLGLAMNHWLGLDDLLARLRERIEPARFQPSTTGSSSAGGEGMKVHKHASSTDRDGGDELTPTAIAMKGATITDDEIRLGPDNAAVKMFLDTTDNNKPIVLCGDPAGDYASLSRHGLWIKLGTKLIKFGNIGGQLGLEIDGNQYMITVSGTRLLTSRIDGS